MVVSRTNGPASLRGVLKASTPGEMTSAARAKGAVEVGVAERALMMSWAALLPDGVVGMASGAVGATPI